MKALNKAYKDLALIYHPDKKGNEAMFQKVKEFKSLFDNLPLIYTDGQLPSRSKRIKIIDYNDEFIKKHIKDKNKALEKILEGKDNKLNGLYSNYEKNCKPLIVSNNDLIDAGTFLLLEKEYKDIKKLYIDKIPEGEKADYVELFDNYAKLYKNCFKEGDANNSDQSVVIDVDSSSKNTTVKDGDNVNTEAAEQARKDAEVAEQARKDAEAAEQARKDAEAAEQARKDAEAAEQARKDAEAAEQARKDAEAAEQARKDAEAAEQARKDAEAADKAKIEATIVNKGNIVLLEKIDVLKVEYNEDISKKVADTIQSHKVQFTEEGINELAKSHEVIINSDKL